MKTCTYTYFFFVHTFLLSSFSTINIYVNQLHHRFSKLKRILNTQALIITALVATVKINLHFNQFISFSNVEGK